MKKRLSEGLASAQASVSRQPASRKGRSDEERRADALEVLSQGEGSAADAVSAARARQKLVVEAGFDLMDARTILPNPDNDYAIDEETVLGLAESIYQTGNTTPIIVRAMPDGYRIVDGERRWRAHMWLGENRGEAWYVIPVRKYSAGELSDEDALLMMDVANLGQRAMTPSERARGVARVADILVSRRQTDPKSVPNIKKEIARRFGISERSAVQEMHIGRDLGEEGMELYDGGAITKNDAEAMAKLDEGSQHEMARRVKEGEVAKGGVVEAVKAKKSDTSDKNARAAMRALTKAVSAREQVDESVLSQISELVEELFGLQGV